MAERYPQTSIWQFQQGYATDLAPQVRELTFLTRAENIMYEVSGAIRKVGGRARLNSTAIASGANIVGMYDFWTSGSAGSDTQFFVAVAGDGTVHNLGSGGTATAITGAATIGSDTIPVFAQLNDLLTIWFDDNSTPLQWSGSGNVSTLSANAPVGRGGIRHINRLFAWGTNADPSRLYWSALGDPTTWTGSDTGSIYVDRNDGDRIVSLVSYKDRLFIFKGPNKGSVHMLTGRTPSDFSLVKLVEGIAVQGPNAAVHVQDDVWYMAQDGIYSLAATERFGDFEQSRLTRLLDTYFRTLLSRSAASLARVSAVDYKLKSCALWTVRGIAQSEHENVLGLSYIRSDAIGLQPFTWTGRSCLSSAIRINASSNNIREVVFGQTDGFITRQDVSDRNLDGTTAYTARVTTPQLVLAPAEPRGDQPVELRRMWLRSRPVGNYDVTIALTRDSLTSESYTFNQSSSGFLLDTSELDTGILGGAALQTVGDDVLGECRSVVIDITQGGLSQDMDIYEVGIDWTPIGTSYTAALNATE